MPAKVLSLKQDDFKGADGSMVTCWKVELDTKTNPIPCYSALAGDLKVGDPLPEGWEVKVSKAGKDYLAVPKAPKGGGVQRRVAQHRGRRAVQRSADEPAHRLDAGRCIDQRPHGLATHRRPDVRMAHGRG